jgi:putative tryptophan/tyrosine transport system substrate-binding protein
VDRDIEKAMQKKITALTLSALLFAVTFPAESQQTGKVFRIGFLDPSNASGMAVLMDAFRQELSKLGWIEGKNIAIEYRFAEGKNERLPELAAELVRLKVDLITVTGGPPTLTAKKATTTIPIVMVTPGDPVGAGLVASLARPGGNVTGLSSLNPELNGKRLELLRDAVPKLARVGLLRLGGDGRGVGISTEIQLKELNAAALALKLKLEEIPTQLDAKGFRERRSNRKGEAGGRDYNDQHSPLFRRKKPDRRACRQIPVAGYLPSEGVCR